MDLATIKGSTADATVNGYVKLNNKKNNGEYSC